MVCIWLNLRCRQRRKQAVYGQLAADNLLQPSDTGYFQTRSGIQFYYNCFGGKIRKIMEERISWTER